MVPNPHHATLAPLPVVHDDDVTIEAGDMLVQPLAVWAVHKGPNTVEPHVGR